MSHLQEEILRYHPSLRRAERRGRAGRGDVVIGLEETLLAVAIVAVGLFLLNEASWWVKNG